MAKRINPSINALSSIIILIITIVLVAINIIPIIQTKNKKGNKL
jgi:spermidine/putrescine transport system permease protein